MADQIAARYVNGLLILVEGWSVTERKRSLAVVSSKKPSSGMKYCLAVRHSEPRFKVVDGVSLDLMMTVSIYLGIYSS